MRFPRVVKVPENAFEGKKVCPIMTAIISIAANVVQLYANWRAQQTLKIISPELAQSGITEERLGIEMIGCECIKEACEWWFQNSCLGATKCQSELTNKK